MSAATAGLMSAATAGQRGKTYLVIDHSNKLGENYLSHIHISASLQVCTQSFTRWGFISLVSINNH